MGLLQCTIEELTLTIREGRVLSQCQSDLLLPRILHVFCPSTLIFGVKKALTLV